MSSDTMRLNGGLVLFVFTLLLAVSIITALRLAQDSENLIEQRIYVDEIDSVDTPEYRMKRQLENFDEDFPTASSQDAPEESGFWDRVVKVALKLFNKFVEWLNS